MTPENRLSEQENHKKPEELAFEFYKNAFQIHLDGKVHQAIKLYQQSLDTYPTAEAHTLMGWALSHLRDLQGAIAECEKAIELDPDYGNPYNDIGAYLIELGKFDEAEGWLWKATEAPRYNLPFFPRFNLGRLYEKQGKWFEAVKQYSMAIDIAEHSGTAYPAAKEAFVNLQAALN